MQLKTLVNYNAAELEGAVRAYWEAGKIPQRMAEHRRGAKPFFLLDGPPYTNAAAHVGHVKTTAFKDIWSRFKYLQGFNSYFQPGFDCHGLPTEVMVEKELGVTSKGDIENKIGIENFGAACLAKATNTEQAWVDYYKLLGAWRAYFEPYFTYKDSYIESAWWTAKKLHEKSLLVEGFKPIHWCSRCETSLSGYEVSDSYKDLNAPSIFVKFKVAGANGAKNSDEYLLVWTTTPWTLPANVAIVVHPEETYVRASSGGETFIFAKKRLEGIEKETKQKFKIISELKGAELDGMKYEPLLAELPCQKSLGEKAHVVKLSVQIMANKRYKKHSMKGTGSQKLEEAEEYEEFVTMDAGTGFVHTAPGHGQTDHFMGKHYALPMVSPVDEKGEFTKEAGQFAGKTTFEADPLIIKHLKDQGKLLHVGNITHRAAVCWRCKTPLIFRLSRQWYLKVDLIKEKMLAENEEVRWMPEFGRVKFQNWLADREDWCLSQQRYWGIPIPFWVCSKCSAVEVIGSRKELMEKSASPLKPSELTDLHRHVVDKIVLKCSACGGKSHRVNDIFNVWFDSGIAPWASLGYPYKNKELFEAMFPVDLITESQDQIRGWFDSLMLCGVGVFGKSPYKAVSMMGWLLDEKGEKMSKSIGNVVWAADGINKLGADAIRLYLVSEVAAWEVQKFSFEQAKKTTQALGILWNCFTFYNTYRLQGRKPRLLRGTDNLEIEDKWILSRLHSTVGAVTRALEEFNFHVAGRALMSFIVEDFSRVYVKLIRDRMAGAVGAAGGNGGTSKESCEDTLFTVLLTTAKLMAPITPFIAEYLYQQLAQLLPAEKLESVHYSSYPQVSNDFVSPETEAMFVTALKITETANSARQAVGIKLRWPLRTIYLGAEKEKSAEAKETVLQLQQMLCKLNNCESVIFAPAPKVELAVKEFAGGTVSIPVKRDEELILASLYRELVRAVQAARKREGLVVSDKIELFVNSSNKGLMQYLKTKQDELSSHVGVGKLHLAAEGGNTDASLQVEDVVISARFNKK